MAGRQEPPLQTGLAVKAAVLTSISLTPAPTFQLALYTFSRKLLEDVVHGEGGT